jgi:hypothetical protein
MIDDPTTVTALMGQMQAQLPIPANPTGALAAQLRSQGMKIASDRVLFIHRVFYAGDEGGITCDVTPTKDAKTAFVVSLTHLRIAPGHPLARAIRAYQRERVRRLAQQDG